MISSPLILFETTHDVLWFLFIMTNVSFLSYMAGWILGNKNKGGNNG